MSMESTPSFNRKSHVSHFFLCLSGIPGSKVNLDTSRIAIVYYCLSGLDILGELDVQSRKVSDQDKLSWRKWFWEHATREFGTTVMTLLDLNENVESRSLFGFRSGTLIPGSEATVYETYDPPHMVMTYAALLSLSILRDNFSNLNRQGVISFLSSTQFPDGSFSPVPAGTIDSERDLRFTFCAFAISSMLNDWSGINVDAALGYIARSRTYEGGYGDSPYREAQGGPTYCALASLQLLAQKDGGDIKDYLTSEEIHQSIRWLVQKQRCGFQGRTEKAPDACYCFWCGASLKILRRGEFVDTDSNSEFLSRCQFMYGGIGKSQGEQSDPFHTYLGLASLSLYPPSQTWLESNNLVKSSWELHQLDPLLNLRMQTVLWARQKIPTNN